MPARSRSRVEAWLRSAPSRRTEPVEGRRPISASHSSVWPFPWTPATPRISPARTSNDTSRTECSPRSPCTFRSWTSSTTSPGRAASLLTRSWTDRPTISAASSAPLVVGGRSPTTFPRRMTVMLSAIAWTSLSLCEMKMIDRPPARSSRMIRNRSSVSPGVSTAVGSSRTSTLASRSSALMISTRCCTPTGRSSTRASGSTCRPNRSESSSTSRRALRRSSRPIEGRPSAGTRSPPRFIAGVASLRTGSAPSVTFSATVKTGTSMKCWCTMPILARIASRGEWIATCLSSSRISPSSGWISP